MSTSEGEVGFLVVRNRKSRRAKSFDSMAGLAAVPMWLGGELSVVRIRMAIKAGGVFRIVVRVAARWQMTLRASHSAMLSGKRILRLSVALFGERRWLETALGMARGAITLVGTFAKLSFV